MKKLLSLVLALVLILSASAFVNAEEAAAKTPKYVFMFIGDGMGAPQITATEYYLGTLDNADKAFPTRTELNFSKFQNVGIMTTMDATSFLPDSASTASSMASGIKTASGVINYTVNDALETQEPVKLITEYAKEAGKKIGVVSSVTTNHATPAAYYAKVPSRNSYYDIAKQFVESNVDFLGGGSFGSPDNKGKDRNIYELAEEAGIQIIDKDAEAIRNMQPTDQRTIAIAYDGAMLYELDRLAEVAKGNDLASLADVTKAAIQALDNENGFFIMVESGKIDWACHANDARSSISDTISLADSVQVALDFMEKNPEETLIVVTGDHETGGLSIGFAATEYDSHYEVLSGQKISYEEMESTVADWREEGNISFDDALTYVEENYGLTREEGKLASLTATDIDKLREAFALSMANIGYKSQNEAQVLSYGGYEPFSMAVSHMVNNKAGLHYTSYSHTGLQLPVYATGVGAEQFMGSYDNTDIFTKMMNVMGLNK